MEQLLKEYILDDQTFLDDYIITETIHSPSYILQYGIIQNTDQKIKITKIKFEMSFLPRFRTLINLFDQGVILADNMFIFKEIQDNQYWIYVIEAHFEIQPQNAKFQTLKHYLQNKTGKQVEIAQKLKLLLEKVHQQGQNYLCLNPTSIIIEQQTNIYLAPYQVNQSIFLQNLKQKNDQYTNAFIAPQLFSKVLSDKDTSKSRIQITKKQLIKADYWSFGCILLELFVLACPAFYCISNQLQIDRFRMFFNKQSQNDDQQFNKVSMIKKIQDKQIKYWANCCLEENLQTRILKDIINIQKSNPTKLTTMVEEVANNHKKSQRIVQIIDNPSVDNQSVLSFSILLMSNYTIQQELKITLNLFSPYTFYIHKNITNNSSKILKLEKSISITAPFQDFHNLFQKQITIQVQDKEFKGQAFINLGMLILKSDNKRIWKKPIIGSYPIRNTKNSKIKISCFLDSNQDDEQKQQIIERYSEQKQKYHEKNQLKVEQQIGSRYQQKEVVVRESYKGRKSEILEITQQLQQLKNIWKNREFNIVNCLQQNSTNKKIANLIN